MPSIPFKPESFKFLEYKFTPKEKKITFNYQTTFTNHDPKNYTETITLPEIPSLSNIAPNLLERVLQDVHLILGISYYKIFTAPKIEITYPLSKEQTEFWNTIYQKGLGEFFYRNNLDPNNSPKFPAELLNDDPRSFEIASKKRSLVAIGGGKDSIISAQLLKDQGEAVTAFTVQTQQNSPIVEEVIKSLKIPSLKLTRILDSNLFDELPGSYNGHIPISAIYAFLGLLCALLYNYKNVIVGNEYSSNFGNLTYRGLEINHQWSKSAEFEDLFRSYLRKFVTADIQYFSLMRPFYEIRIANMFTYYKNYFHLFTSCNRNFTISKKLTDKLWCGQCPKCVFNFTLFSAFLSKRVVLKIFGKNLFEDENLLPLIKDLLGFGDMKPFDCVGTFEETQAALYLSTKKYSNSLAIKTFLPQIKNADFLVKKLFQTNKSLAIPTKFRFSGMNNALVIGFGKEGKATYEFLKSKFPKLKLQIADKKKDKDYLSYQNRSDIAIKTPGINKKFVNIQYTTATNLFFAQNPGITIGVTGSKGKSTTASLIYTILNEAGFKVYLLGNIGKPMLTELDRPHSHLDIFVLELSSFQLDDIEFSPHIAVVTNLFHEHTDYHSSVEHYNLAKRNIINNQRKNDFFVYNPKDARLSLWAVNSTAVAIPFRSDLPLATSEIPIRGEHNLDNVRAAVTVARILTVPENLLKQALIKFKPLPHRLEYVGTYRDIVFYDDAISTIPESTIMAIETLPNVDTILLGGEDRGYDFSVLEEEIRRHNIKNVVLFPVSGKRILKDKQNLNILETTSMEEAVKFAYKNTKSGGVCLLSCASPSYSLWRNFEEKGDEFKKFVKFFANLPETKS